MMWDQVTFLASVPERTRSKASLVSPRTHNSLREVQRAEAQVILYRYYLSLVRL